MHKSIVDVHKLALILFLNHLLLLFFIYFLKLKGNASTNNFTKGHCVVNFFKSNKNLEDTFFL